ncbi:unnamed protein product, partial [Urochloa humidicola]
NRLSADLVPCLRFRLPSATRPGLAVAAPPAAKDGRAALAPPQPLEPSTPSALPSVCRASLMLCRHVVRQLATPAGMAAA